MVQSQSLTSVVRSLGEDTSLLAWQYLDKMLDMLARTILAAQIYQRVELLYRKNIDGAKMLAA